MEKEILEKLDGITELLIQIESKREVPYTISDTDTVVEKLDKIIKLLKENKI